jgi:hypothetical protein
MVFLAIGFKLDGAIRSTDKLVILTALGPEYR